MGRDVTQDTPAALDVADAYGRYGDELIRFATVLVGRDDAVDVLSAVFVKLLENPDRCPPPFREGIAVT